MRTKLRSSGVDCPSICLFCDQHLENCLQLFVGCPHSIVVLEAGNIYDCVAPGMDRVERF